MTIFDILFAINTPGTKVQRSQYRAMVKFLRERIATISHADHEQRIDFLYYLMMLHLTYEEGSSNTVTFAGWYKEFCSALHAHEAFLKERFKELHRREAHHRGYLQLMYFYKLTLSYFDQLIERLTARSFITLAQKTTAERLLFYSHKKLLQGKYVDFFDVKRQEFSYRFSKHSALFALIGSIGFIMFWHGLSGVIDLIPILNIPVISLVFGLSILVLSGFFYTFAGQHEKSDRSDS